MNDLSALVGWPPLAVGLIASIWAGRSMRGPRGVGKVLGAGILALMLGVFLTFATAAAHTYCVEGLRLCKSHGDGNMSYWFHSLIAVPVFWVAMLALGSDTTEPLLAEARRQRDSVAEALGQFRRNEEVTQTCPACASELAVNQLVSGDDSRTVQVRCSCGQCDGKYEIRGSAA